MTLYNVGPTSKTLGRRCINVIQMFCVCWVALKLIDHISNNLDTGKVTFSIFLDFSKAFDTLDHTILTQKLRHHCIKGCALKLLKNYLSNRKQYVELNNVKSEMCKIKTGVPQGSILGP